MDALAALGTSLGTGMLATGTAANAIGAGVLTGAGVGAGVQGLSNVATGQDFLNNMGESAGMGALSGGAFGGLGFAGNEAAAAEKAAVPAANAAAQIGSQAATQAGTQAATQAGQSVFANGQPLEAIGNLGQKFNSADTLTKLGVQGISGTMLDSMMQPPNSAKTTQDNSMDSKFKWVGGPSTYTYDPSRFTPNIPVPETVTPSYATGGITDLDGYLSQAQNTPTTPISNSMANNVIAVPATVDTADPEGYAGNSAALMAKGGIASVNPLSQADEGMLQGCGDGLSDDIHATLKGKHPVRLADGEFIVSADVVSALGNGSSNAGAKKLYAMMDNVRKQAHGKKEQIKPVSKKVIPS